MANRYATQGAIIAARLKKRPCTYMDMLKMGVSTCPQKRVREWLAQNDGWQLVKPKRRDGLVQWRLVPV